MPKSNFKYGIKAEQITNKEWMKSGMVTFGSIIICNSIYPEGLDICITTKNLKTKRFGNEHAEDVMIRYLRNEGLQYLVSGREVNEIIFNISKSPCSSTYRTTNKLKGCTEELIDFHNEPLYEGGKVYRFNVHVIARSIYKQSESSTHALELMVSNGIKVQTDVFLRKDNTPMKKMFA